MPLRGIPPRQSNSLLILFPHSLDELSLCDPEALRFTGDRLSNPRKDLGVKLMGSRARLPAGFLPGRSIKKPQRLSRIVNAPNFLDTCRLWTGLEPRKSI